MVDVELVRADKHLVGTVGQQRVELVLDIPDSRAGLRGESLGAPVGGYWRIESNFTRSGCSSAIACRFAGAVARGQDWHAQARA